MTWTPARVELLEQGERYIQAATHKLVTVIEDVTEESPQRDSLIAANEHLAIAQKNLENAREIIREVLDHARVAREFTDAAIDAVGGGA